MWKAWNPVPPGRRTWCPWGREQYDLSWERWDSGLLSGPHTLQLKYTAKGSEVEYQVDGYSYASAFRVWLTVAKLDTARCLSIAHGYISSCKGILAYNYSPTHVQYAWSLNVHWVGKNQIQMDNVVFHMYAVLCYLVRNGAEQGAPGTWGYKMGRVLVWDEK